MTDTCLIKREFERQYSVGPGLGLEGTSICDMNHEWRWLIVTNWGTDDDEVSRVIARSATANRCIVCDPHE